MKRETRELLELWKVEEDEDEEEAWRDLFSRKGWVGLGNTVK